jgi:hypothetical protein
MRFKIKTFIQRSIRHNYKMAIKVKGRQVINYNFQIDRLFDDLSTQVCRDLESFACDYPTDSIILSIISPDGKEVDYIVG